MSDLHPSLPRLPVDARGYPVPWFVQWFHADGSPAGPNFCHAPGDYPDFRVMDQRKMAMAYNERRCWVCGERLGKYYAFVIGPMCAVNRTSGEPPAHRECAIFSATGCPFLSKPAVDRRENSVPQGVHVHPAMLDRNPGVAMVWVTFNFLLERTGNEVVFRIGDPEEVLFFALGRTATREEIMHSIDTGMPFLREIAEKQGADALKELSEMYDEAVQLVAAA